MSEALISVIVPVYNAQKYLDGCMETILNQTWQNLEILLVDDGSTDESGAMCDAYATQDKRVRGKAVRAKANDLTQYACLA